MTLTTFTDPMMGLSWEMEPVYRKLETHFGNAVEFSYRMGLLARHPLISVQEVREAFDLPSDDKARQLAGPLVDAGVARLVSIKDSWFLSKR